MALFGMGVSASAFVAAMLATGFFLVWWLALSELKLPDERVSSAAPPVSPALPAARPAPEGTAAAVDPDSRWIDVFGPPETGQLPIQRYVPDSESARSGHTGQMDSALPQWSHSRD